MSVLYWNEPTESGDTVVSCSIAEAVALQRASALRHGYEYASDDEALEDFKTIHWAWQEGA